MGRPLGRSYRAAQVFYASVLSFVMVATLCVVAFGYGLWLPRYQSTLDRSRSRLTVMLAESVADDVRRGNVMLARTRLSRLAGVGGISSTALVDSIAFSDSEDGNQFAFDSLILSGGPGSKPLARLRVTFGREEEAMASMAISVLLLVTMVTALALFFLIERTGTRLLIKPLGDVARQVRESDETEQIQVPKLVPVEIRDVVEAHNQRISTIATLNEEKAQLSQKAAVARMTQMLAHDVRKPFSILRMGLHMLGNAKDPESVKRVLSRLVPEVDKAVSNVDGLIADVMEIGSSSTQLIQEPAVPEALIEAALADLCRVHPQAAVKFSYDFQHSHPVSVHVQKVARIFSNILGNAVQAMKYEGEVWFKTRDGNGLVEFCIGNSGSVIPPDHLPKLFDAFFTSGKKGGTGLGLAIAQKVVTAHGGTIRCDSSVTPEHPAGQVEFWFTLPVAVIAEVPRFDGVLPRHTSEVLRTSALAQADQESGQTASVSKAEVELEADIQVARAELGRPIRVLIIDDEEVYRQGLHGAMSRNPDLAAALATQFAAASAEALAKIHARPFDLVISDVDLGAESLSGFELVRDIRRSDAHCLVCIHSNRMVAEDHKTAIASGADAFLPKPMAPEHLLKLILQAAERALADSDTADAAEAVAPPVARPEVALVEDNAFMREAWVKMLATDATVHAASSPEALLDKLSKDPGLLGRLACVVTDYYFDNSTQNGVDVGRMIKHCRPGLRVLLSSDGSFAADEMAGAIDRVIAKDPVSYAGLPS